MKVDVSIIIVNWNTRKLLIDCIDSIKKETHCKYEIIVVDNDSSDDSVEHLKKFHPDVILIENDKNLGFAKANNIGMKISQGKYVCLINTDVIVLENTIDRLTEYMEAHPDTGAIGPQTVDKNYKLQESNRRFPRLWHFFCETLFFHHLFPKSSRLHGHSIPSKYLHKDMPAENLSGCFLQVSKSVIDEIGGFDDKFYFYGEDVDWCKRIENAGWKLFYLGTVKSIHFGGGSTIQKPVKYHIEMEKADLRYWLKHNSKPVVVLYFLLSLFHNLLRWVLLAFAAILKKNFFKINRNKIRGRKARFLWLLQNFKLRLSKL